MPLVLVPMVGAAPVVPIIAISAMFTNTARVTAFRRFVDLRRAVIALVVALPACALGAWLYTLLTGRGAALVIGTTLIATVPLRRLLKRRGHHLGEKGFVAGCRRLGLPDGRHDRRGRHLVVAADGDRPRRRSRDRDRRHGFGRHRRQSSRGVRPAGVLTPQVIVIACLIGVVGVSLHVPGKLIVERLPVHVHTVLLDAVVVGGVVMISARAFGDRIRMASADSAQRSSDAPLRAAFASGKR